MALAFDTLIIKLTWEDPSTGEENEMVAPLPLDIGRNPENQLTVNSALVSRSHARLDFEGGKIVLSDLGSTNGTQFNGENIRQVSIWDGDVFDIGPFTFTLLIADPDEYQPVAPGLVIDWGAGSDTPTGHLKASSPITIGRARSNTISLESARVSREHAAVIWEGGVWFLVDLQSTNGTFLNGQPVARAMVKPGDRITVGEFELRVSLPPQEAPPAGQATMVASSTTVFQQTQLMEPPFAALDRETTQLVDVNPQAMVEAGPRADIQDERFPPPLFDTHEMLPVATLGQLGFPISESVYLSVGGGLGSFAWVDSLRIHGAGASDIRVLGVEAQPYGRFKRLAEQSQIPDWERLRSSSDATPDNIWGFPGYALREMWRDLMHGRLLQVFKTAWQLFTEPDLRPPYTPVAGQVYQGLDRESKRIGYPDSWEFGRVRAIRKTDDGRYVVAYSQTGSDVGRRHCLHIARFLHLAVGYPAIRFLSDLQDYRQSSGDFKRVVNAYEPHDHVYQALARNGGTVLVRGRTIVASRVLQRLCEVRLKNPAVRILHLMRTPRFKGHRFGPSRRKTRNHWEYQAFNWPKSAWGGEHLELLRKADPLERDRLLNDLGGTTTSDRRDWIQVVEQGLDQGWYEIQFGNVARVERDEASGKLSTVIRGKTAIQGASSLLADYIIDATGLEATLDTNPLLKDLAAHYELPRNIKRRLEITPAFELEGLRNGAGRVYASGSITLGSAYAPVDSFLGLQHAAQLSVDDLLAQQAPGLRKLTALRSLGQWLRWLRGVAP